MLSLAAWLLPFPRQRALATASRLRSRSTLSDEFSWIQNIIWIEHLLEAAVKITRDIARCLWPPALFCQADSVFACDHTAPPQHLGKKIVERAFDFFAHSRVAIVSIG